MRIVVADTSPINYLILIGHIDILPVLFTKVILTTIVSDELKVGPQQVRSWLASSQPWIEIRNTTGIRQDADLENLDAGEEDAIALAIEMNADLLLMDDREGVLAARRNGLKVLGTLGILALAAQRNSDGCNPSLECKCSLRPPLALNENFSRTCSSQSH